MHGTFTTMSGYFWKLPILHVVFETKQVMALSYVQSLQAAERSRLHSCCPRTVLQPCQVFIYRKRCAFEIRLESRTNIVAVRARSAGVQELMSPPIVLLAFFLHLAIKSPSLPPEPLRSNRPPAHNSDRPKAWTRSRRRRPASDTLRTRRAACVFHSPYSQPSAEPKPKFIERRCAVFFEPSFTSRPSSGTS